MKTETMHSITGMKRDGPRSLSYHNWRHTFFNTSEQAQEHLEDVIANNNTKTIEETMGKELKVSEVQCYPGGDAIGIYWD